MRRAVWLAAGALLLAPGVFAQEDDTTVVRTTEDGLRFKLPPDWPIKQQGTGDFVPAPVEEYLAIKFKALEAQLQAIDQRLNSLDLRLRVFEQASQTKNLQSGEHNGAPQ